MSTYLNPITVSFCDTCNIPHYQFGGRPELNIVNEQPGKVQQIYPDAEYSVKLSQVIETIKAASQSLITQGTAKIRYNTENKQLEVLGNVQNYTHKCKKANEAKSSAEESLEAEVSKIDPQNVDWDQISRIMAMAKKVKKQANLAEED